MQTSHHHADWRADRAAFLQPPICAGLWTWLGVPRRPGAAFVYLQVALDVAGVFAAYFLAYWLREDVLGKKIVVGWLASAWVPAVLACVVLFCMQYTRGYHDRRFIRDLGDWPNILRAVLASVVLSLVLAVLAQLDEVRHISRTFIVLYVGLLAAFLLAGRMLLWLLRGWLRRSGADRKRVLLIGSHGACEQVRRYMDAHPASGLQCLGILGPPSRTSAEPGRAAARPTSGSYPAELAPIFQAMPGEPVDTRRLDRAIRRLRAHEVIIAWPEAPLGRVVTLIVHLQAIGVGIRIVHPSFNILRDKLPFRFETIGDTPIVDLQTFSHAPMHRVFKRAFDLAFALLVFVLGLPIWLLIGLLIRRGDGHPALYRQPRVRSGGQVFGCYKFRTMVPDAEALQAGLAERNILRGPMFKIPNDPRITPLGRVLRRYSLDEIPQFLNVLRLELSVVGARPPRVDEVAQYEPWQMVRLRGWVGITGLWQICGRSEVSFDDVVLFDLFYDANTNIYMDLAIILRTILVMFSGKGGY